MRAVLPARRRFSILGTLASLTLAALFATGCGSDDSPNEPEVAGPLPVGEESAAAYTEHFLVRNPHALARPEHLVITDLEPVFAGADDTCAGDDGVDCVPYHFDADTRVRLTIDEEMSFVERIRLRERDGPELLRFEPGDSPAEALVPTGDYVVELTHALAGNPDAPTEVVFLRPNPPTEEEQGEDSPPTLVLQAQSDCLQCNFKKAKLENQVFDGKGLHFSDFSEAHFFKTSFKRSGLNNTKFRYVVPASERDKNFVDRYDADFSGSEGASLVFSVDVDQSQQTAFYGVFRDARLGGSSWGATETWSCPGTHCQVLQADFRRATLTGADFHEIILRSNTVCPAQSRIAANACSFEGADLTVVTFRSAAKRHLAHCRFGRDPDTQRQTKMHGTILEDQSFVDADLSDVDLSGASLLRANLTDQPKYSTYCTEKGADFSRAILTGAKIAGVNFRGANLSGATLTGIVPAVLDGGMDFSGTNFAGTHLAGVDISTANFSKAVPFTQGLPDFAGAKLSNGTRGVNVEGQKFPDTFTGFKGLDLTGAILNRAGLHQANLEGTKLIRAQLVGATLSFSNLRGAMLQGASFGVEPGSDKLAATLRGAYMVDVDLTDADLRSVDLTGAHLYGNNDVTKLVRVRLDSADMTRAIVSNAVFSGSFNNTVFNNAQLVNTVFNGATLTNTKFDDAYLQGADFSNVAGVTGTSLINAAISAQAGVWPYTEQNGVPFTLRYEATKLGSLATQATVHCPNGQDGPCCPDSNVAACLASGKLKPKENGPFPPVPKCKPAREYCYENCLDPPNFNHRPPC